MITFATETTITDAEFDRIYAESLVGVENGWPWNWWPDAITAGQKKAFIRGEYDLFLGVNSESYKSGLPAKLTGSLVFSVRDADRLIGLFAATLSNGDMEVHLSLFGLDASASKAWAYGNEQSIQARNSYWDSLGVNGWVFAIPDLPSDLKAYITNTSGTLMGVVANSQTTTNDTPPALIEARNTPATYGMVHVELAAAA